MSQSTVDDDLMEYPKLPAAFFPACWADDERMNVLLAPFRPKSLNAINYDSKLNFWSNLIRKYCETKGSAKVTVSELRHVFQWKHKKPYALETVFKEMYSLGEVQSLGGFMEPPQHTWRGWAQRSVTKAIAWPILKVKDQLWRPVALNESDEYSRSHVVCSVVKNQADQLLSKYPHVDRVVNLEDVFEHACGLSREGTELALHHLQCIKRAIIMPYTSPDGTKMMLVKLAGPSKIVNTITDVQLNLFELNLSLDKMTQKTESLEHELQQVDAQIRQLLRDNKKASAKVQLRMKKTLEQKLEKNTSIISNIQSMVASIDETNQTVEIVSSYRLAASTLKQAYAETGLTVDKVDDALADVQEAIDDHREMQDVISGATTLKLDSTGLDDSELEAELDELLELEKLESMDRDKELDESIEKRLKQLNMNGFADLSIEEQREIISSSVGSVDELLKHNITNKKMESAKQ